MFRHIPAEAIPGEWGRLSELLAPAVSQDPNATLDGLHRNLKCGRCAALDVILPNAHGVLIVETIEDGGLVLWVNCIAGSIDGGPKRWLETMRSLMAGLQQIAKRTGYWEVRICGRDWSRIFPDFTPHHGERYELRKAL